MKRIFVIFFLLGHLSLIGQSLHRLAVQLRPLHFIDLQASTVMLGVNSHFTKRWGVNLDVKP
ncbi:MAG: hypothetical protein ACKVTZ_06960 [Bacteroidia bacterium]